MDTPGRTVREPSFPRVARQTPTQRLFLRRLERLAMLDRYGRSQLAFSEAESLLLRKATYSVYRDCIELGVQREARAILRATARSAG